MRSIQTTASPEQDLRREFRQAFDKESKEIERGDKAKRKVKASDTEAREAQDE